MTAADACQFVYLPPTSFLGPLDTFVQVKSGAGVLRYIYCLDDLSPGSSAQYSVYDGVLVPTAIVGGSPSVNGQLLFTRAANQMGPMRCSFANGLIVQYTNNQPQHTGFVAYQ